MRHRCFPVEVEKQSSFVDLGTLALHPMTRGARDSVTFRGRVPAASSAYAPNGYVLRLLDDKTRQHLRAVSEMWAGREIPDRGAEFQVPISAS